MKMRKLMATKPHRYGTRHLTAGEQYEVPPRHAFALVASKKARFADKMAKKAPAAIESTGTKSPAPELQPEPTMSEAYTADRLRMEATQLGIDVDGRWGVPRLQHEIAQAKR